MNLYRKYRPKTLKTFLGNVPTVRSLVTKIESEDRPHAYLFTGPSGCGKTTLARITASELGADENNLHELDSASFRGIDTVREIRRTMHMNPLGGGTCRVWILDEVHQMTPDAQEALLKALEDTPEHVYFMLCTTEPQKLKTTLKNRCTPYSVTTLNDKRMYKLLHKVVVREHKAVPVATLELIVRNSIGSPRQGLVLLEKVIDLDKHDMEKAVEKFAKEQGTVIDLCRALMKNAGWPNVKVILKGLQDQNADTVRRAVMGYCNKVLLGNADAKTMKRVYFIMDNFKNNFYDTGHPELSFACLQTLMDIKEG